MRRNDQTEFEVIILGAGIAGTILGAILAKHGRKVLMLDGAVHPRFAVGASTIPHTSQLLTLLAREHDIPQLRYIGLGSPALRLRGDPKGQEWTLRHPRARDRFLGRPERHERWMKQLPDEHLC